MDSVTIKLYKDGSDIIVVFKNASDDLLEVVKKTLEIQVAPTLVPDLEAPPEYHDEPLNIPSEEFLIPTFRIQSFSDFVETTAELMNAEIDAEKMKACRNFYESHDKIMANTISTLALPRVKGFVANCYKMSMSVVESFSTSQYSTINEWVDSLSEHEVRKTAKEIGDNVVSFFEITN